MANYTEFNFGKPKSAFILLKTTSIKVIIIWASLVAITASLTFICANYVTSQDPTSIDALATSTLTWVDFFSSLVTHSALLVYQPLMWWAILLAITIPVHGLVTYVLTKVF